MVRNQLILTTICCLHIVMKVCSIPIHSKTKTSSLNDKFFQSQTRRQKRSDTPSFSIFIITRNSKRFVEVKPKNITALALTKKAKYAELIITKLGFEGQISIMGKASKRYICMNSTGKVILMKTRMDPNCTFIKETHKPSGYFTLRSAMKATWYLGFKKRGDIRHGHNTEQHHRAAWVMFVEPDYVK